MNELIKELAEQAMESTGIEGLGGSYMELNTEKFAELIIKECGVALRPMLRDMVSRGQAYDLIKQHFGVNN